MSSVQKVLIYQPQGASEISGYIAENFQHSVAVEEQACLELLCDSEFVVLVLDLIVGGKFSIEKYAEFLQDEAVRRVPVIVLSPTNELANKLKAFELGCDDVLFEGNSPKEVVARVQKSIFNAIANAQLKSRLKAANETAFSAMADNSDLGSNVQFLVEANQCKNLDELGQLLFQTVEQQGLSCSLQMRSLYGNKNMEANGMAKDLESQLLEQMANAGRYVDFGKRTIMNYGQASLLIRNMPLDNEKRYGSLKDNLFYLLMGVDARIKALDTHNKLHEEKDALHQMSRDVRNAMDTIEKSYQHVMRDIATVVEDLADQVFSRIPTLALSEEQEQFFEMLVTNCVCDTNKIFNEGLKVDHVFGDLCQTMDKALVDIEIIEAQSAQIVGGIKPDDETGSGPDKKGIELF